MKRSGRMRRAVVCALLALSTAGRTEEPPPPESKVVVEEIVVRARKPRSTASSDEIRARDFALRPHATVQEILNNVPGLVVAQHQGGGKAAQFFVRGFDADHGTDFAVSVDGLPVNLVSHAHGQGYADLNLVIPETVERLRLRKGPYFPDVGDFATAGALDLVTRDEVEENFVLAEGGSFATHRYAAAISPRLSARGDLRTLVAGQLYLSDGPFRDPQEFRRGNAFAKVTFDPAPGSTVRLSGSAYAGEWNGSGQIPLREVAAGRLGRFGAVDPTEGGRTDREDLNLRWDHAPDAASRWTVQLYGSRYQLRLFSNFTFFRDTGLRFVREPDGSVRDLRGAPAAPDGDYVPGDGIDQDDSRLLWGGRIGYGRVWAGGPFPMESEAGAETRSDHADVALHRQVRRRRFFTVNDLRVNERSFGGWARHQIFPAEWLRLDVGLRGDFFLFDADDRLPVQPDDPSFEARPIDGFTSDGIVSPKATLVFTPAGETDLYVNFGTGFHSNDVRNAVASKGSAGASPLVRALGWEVGSRTRLFGRVDLGAAFWWLDLDEELVFSSDAGDLETGAGGIFEPSPATRRMGVDFEARWPFTGWLEADYDLTWTRARYRASGAFVPLAPTLLMNGGLTATFPGGFSAALRARFLDDRPANEEGSLVARGYTLLDLLARWRWRSLEATLRLRNLGDVDWREAQFEDATCIRREVGSATGCFVRPDSRDPDRPEPVPDLHFTPGTPFSVEGGVTVYF